MAKGRGFGRGGSKGVVMLEAEEGGASERGDGNCCIAWDCEGAHLISSNSHSTLFFHSWPASSSPGPLRRLAHHRSAITGLAFSPSGSSLASCSLDHSVKLFSYPGGEFQSNVTRFTLPIRSVAFSITGSMLAAAGEDDGIKLISTIDSSIVRVFKGHNAPVVSLSFDPNNEYLASAGSDGTIMCWSLSSGKRVHTLYHAAPNTDLNSSCRNEVAWHPKGDVLAVPGRKNGVDVVMYDRDTGEKVFSLKGGHSATVGFLAWSFNGKYIATSAGDNQVILWDVDNRQDIDSQKFESQICSLAWKPNGNALAVMDADGKFGVWEPIVPAHMALPNDTSTQPSAIDREELLRFSDDDDLAVSEDEDKTLTSDRERSASPDIFSRSRKQKDTEEFGSLKKSSVSKKSDSQPQNKQMASSVASLPTMQKAFQPGSTQPDGGIRHFLNYNLVGSVTSCQNEGLSHVEVEFHDTGRGFRVPAMTDYFGFTMAAMNETGSVFASPRKGEKSPSTVLYRPFSSWASNSEWSMRLPAEEEARAVAVGLGWVAATTSLNHLRVYSEAGLQMAVLSLQGPVVTMTGHQEVLAVATHAAVPFPCGQQVIHCMVLNLAAHTKVIEGWLPLSPGSQLTWLGFSEAGLLSFYDSKGLLRVHTSQYGGSWLPVFSASKEAKNEDESLWMVGLTDTQVMCVACKFPDKQPQVSPKPVLSIFNLSLPLVHSDLGAEDLENEFLLKSWQLAQITDEAVRVNDEDEHEEEILKLEATLDRCILRLIAAACKGDKLMKAVELTKKLSLDKSWKGAIKLVSAMKLPALAERLSTMYEEKITHEASQEQELVVQSALTGQVRNTAIDASLNTEGFRPSATMKHGPAPDVQRIKSSLSNGHVLSHKQKVPSIGERCEEASKSSLSNDHVLPQKQRVPSTEKRGEGPTKSSTTGTFAEDNGTHLEDKATLNVAQEEEPFQRSSNPFAKSASNPFAKPPVATDSHTGGVSLLESLKRMRDTELDLKGKVARSNKAVRHS
ncbi:hypothetical protein GOP47_0006352 [Adiantum capillus-veneris]|uniref:Minichromosome loss protein Mcl1 middle region domain-containing protein n=1 Tax=Adiantum capillus-veneris TaxID=13818 RepID=A0A9D4V3F3_ADICA|nr:hypothetical protein GOP47_0006352 [Adiantum capillus-veneris]